MKTLSKKSEINIINGDIFNFITQYISQGNNGTSIIVPHVCNNIDLFDAGFAGAVAKKYPLVKNNYHMLGANFLKNNLGYTQFVEVKKDPVYEHKLIFANMIAQNGVISSHNQRPLNYFALCKSMSMVKKYIMNNFEKDNRVQLHCPRFGCGLAGGDWKLITNLIEDIWTDIPVFVYNFKK